MGPAGDFVGEPVEVSIGEKPWTLRLKPWSSLSLVTTTRTPSMVKIPDSHGDVMADTRSGRVASREVVGALIPDGPAGMSIGLDGKVETVVTIDSVVTVGLLSAVTVCAWVLGWAGCWPASSMTTTCLLVTNMEVNAGSSFLLSISMRLTVNLEENSWFGTLAAKEERISPVTM